MTCSGVTPNFWTTPSLVEPGAVLARVVDADARADQLEEVLVDRDDRDLEALGARPHRHRPDHVVRLVAGGGHDRHAHRFARLVHPVDLFGEIVGHGRAVRLVVGDELIAKRRAGEIERRGDVLGMVIVDQLAEHRHEDVDRVRRLSFLIREPAAAKRVIRAVHLRAAIDQEERAAGHVRGSISDIIEGHADRRTRRVVRRALL